MEPNTIKLFGKRIFLPEQVDRYDDASSETAEVDPSRKQDDGGEDSAITETTEVKKKKKPERKLLKKPERILPCPRCSSRDTKFCYYNNYNVNQPRYFCKVCQRYWTEGGTMRNVPVGAGKRKSKHSNFAVGLGSDATILSFGRGSIPVSIPVVYASPTFCDVRVQSSPVLIPKTLRINDPEEAARSSIWTTLGIKRPFVGNRMFPSMPEKAKTAATILPALSVNPAALSRSMLFHESS